MGGFDFKTQQAINCFHAWCLSLIGSLGTKGNDNRMQLNGVDHMARDREILHSCTGICICTDVLW